MKLSYPQYNLQTIKKVQQVLKLGWQFKILSALLV